jgi:DNA modification methylase
LQSKRPQRTSEPSPSKRPKTDLPGKCLLQIPARFAVAMIERGWILRNEIIWHKPTAMPDGAKDRFTVDFEKVFFFVKQRRYWFDLDSVREPHREHYKVAALKQAEKMGCRANTSYKDWYFKRRKKFDWVGGKHNLLMRKLAARSVAKTKLIHPLGRAKRCVWSIATRPFFENHFATYPSDLIETPIKAGCPKGGIVLDPFIGSGTTALVAKKLGRNFIGIDLNLQYVRIAKKRLSKEQS